MIGDAQIDVIPVDPEGLIIPSVIFTSIRDANKRISSIGNSILNNCVAVQIHSLSSISNSHTIEEVEHIDRVHSLEDSIFEGELELVLETRNGNLTPNRLHSIIEHSSCQLTGIHHNTPDTIRLTLKDTHRDYPKHPNIHEILGLPRPDHYDD